MDTTLKKVMTDKLFVIAKEMSIYEAHLLMNEKRVRHLPVVNEKNDIVGIVSQIDLNADGDSRTTSVASVMNTSVQYVDKNMNLKSAIFKMLELKISCLLVADESNNAVGIVTTDDLLWCLARFLPDEQPISGYEVFKSKALQTIGEIANELSLMGF